MSADIEAIRYRHRSYRDEFDLPDPQADIATLLAEVERLTALGNAMWWAIGRNSRPVDREVDLARNAWENR